MNRKILFYINTIVRNGAERVMTNLANQCVTEGYEVVFVTSYSVLNEYKLENLFIDLIWKVKKRSSLLLRGIIYVF